MKRLHRLTAILVKLQSKKVVQAAILSDHFGVSLRTIYRDIQALIEAGVPIGAEAGVGYFLVEGYTLPPVMFTEQQANALLTAEKIIATTNDTSLQHEYREALDKVIAVLQPTRKEKLALLEDRMHMSKHNQPPPSTAVILIQKAITDHRILIMEYLDVQQQITKRNIHPLGMYFTNHVWVMIAYCHLRKAYREFRTDRIQNLIETVTIAKAIDFDLKAYFQCQTNRTKEIKQETNTIRLKK